MSGQKCMSVSKCFNLEAKNIINSKLCHQRDKRSNYQVRKKNEPLNNSDVAYFQNFIFVSGCQHPNLDFDI